MEIRTPVEKKRTLRSMLAVVNTEKKPSFQYYPYSVQSRLFVISKAIQSIL